MKKRSAHVERRLREVARQAREAELARLTPKKPPMKLRPTRPVAMRKTDADRLREIAEGLRRAMLVNYAAELDRIASAATEPPST